MWAKRIVVATLLALSVAVLAWPQPVGRDSRSPPESADWTESTMAGNLAPVADAGPDLVGHVGRPLDFNASSSYDPDRTGVWSNATPLPFPVLGIPGMAGATEDAIYVFGGVIGSFGYSNQTRLNTTLRYDLLNETWEMRAPFPAHGRGWASVAPGGGGFLLFGGGTDVGIPYDALFFDPLTDAWTERAPTPCAFSHSAALADGLVYAHFDGSDWFCAYDPVADVWSVRAKMPTFRAADYLVSVRSEER